MLSKAFIPFANYNEREISCTTLTLFLTVAEAGDDGVIQADLALKLGVAKSSISRNACLLSDATHKGKPGMGLIRRDVHPHDARINVLRLTDRGQQMYQQILNAI